jgi:HD-GYP domain-containing protein (c-di-GMP phosphodiesterase class II)
VADVWDALTSRRVYRDALSPDDARQILQREAGDRLDRSCVRALFAILDRDPGFTTRSAGLNWAG